MYVVLYNGKEESVVIESSMMQESPSDGEYKPQDRAEHSPLLTEEDTSSEETRKLSVKTATQPQVYMCTLMWMVNVHVTSIQNQNMM